MTTEKRNRIKWLGSVLALLALAWFLGRHLPEAVEDVPAPPPMETLVAHQAPEEFTEAVKADSARSAKWAAVRRLHLKREPFCAWCGGTVNLQVHHIHPFALNPKLHGSDAPGGELDDGKDGTGRDGNLITLCMVPKDKAKHPEDADHHELHGHNGHFHGGENLKVREECTAHEKELRRLGKWPDNATAK